MRYQPMSRDVEAVWSEMENNLFAGQEAFEEYILQQMKKDEEKAKAELTKYCIDNAEKAVNDYWQLGDELWGKYTNYF